MCEEQRDISWLKISFMSLTILQTSQDGGPQGTKACCTFSQRLASLWRFLQVGLWFTTRSKTSLTHIQRYFVYLFLIQGNTFHLLYMVSNQHLVGGPHKVVNTMVIKSYWLVSSLTSGLLFCSVLAVDSCQDT